MNIFSVPYLSRSLLLLSLVIAITACATLPGTFEVQLQPEAQAVSQITVLDELKPVLDAILFGSIEQRRELVSYTTTGCTNADGLGGPPKCEPGQAEGSLIQVLPILSSEGTFSTPQDIDQALEFVVMDLYAIYRVPEDAIKADYWPAGEYGLIFTREMNAVPFPVTVFVEDGRIVRLHHHFGTQPEDLLGQLPVEQVILDSKAAKKWVTENSPVSPPIQEVENGTISGSICYPSESIPNMTLYFQEINRGDLAYQSHPGDQTSYSIDLPPGSYIAFAYPDNSPEVGGLYSQAVVCGLEAECADHAPVIFEVKPGQETSGVNICDWYAPEDVPPDPLSDENTSGPVPTGSITGKICYPSEFIPEMTLFVQEISSQEISELFIAENQNRYNMNLIPGMYIAFAYLNSGATLMGSYSNAVLCGLNAGCADHSLVEFEVKAGQTLEDIDICDWYSTEAAPPDPRVKMQPLVNMIYTTMEGDYYRVKPNGQSVLIFSGPTLALPYTGPYGVYLENNDLQAIDLFTGEGYQITHTPDLRETSYHFEIGLPEQLLFTALPVDQEVWPGYTGGLYIVNMDGTNQRTIDSEHNAANFAASDDGQRIAYGAGETTFLYNWESGVEFFDPREYGMDSPKGQAIASPSWAPYSDVLAWSVSGFFENGATQGYGIFDLTDKTFRLIHPYQGLGMDVTPPSAQWSPDGEWLVITVFDQDPESSGVWLVNFLDPKQEIFMGNGTSNPVFGPWTRSKKLLSYSRIDQTAGGDQTWIFDLQSGEHQLTPLPPNARVVTWW
ncbi:MAG: hypothetical protein ACK2UM_12910 [Anaerolineales bacterium]